MWVAGEEQTCGMKSEKKHVSQQVCGGKWEEAKGQRA